MPFDGPCSAQPTPSPCNSRLCCRKRADRSHPSGHGNSARFMSQLRLYELSCFVVPLDQPERRRLLVDLVVEPVVPGSALAVADRAAGRVDNSQVIPHATRIAKRPRPSQEDRGQLLRGSRWLASPCASLGRAGACRESRQSARRRTEAPARSRATPAQAVPHRASSRSTL